MPDKAPSDEAVEKWTIYVCPECGSVDLPVTEHGSLVCGHNVTTPSFPGQFSERQPVEVVPLALLADERERFEAANTAYEEKCMELADEREATRRLADVVASVIEEDASNVRVWLADLSQGEIALRLGNALHAARSSLGSPEEADRG